MYLNSARQKNRLQLINVSCMEIKVPHEWSSELVYLHVDPQGLMLVHQTIPDL